MPYIQNQDPYLEFATQIASLVQQLQVSQTLQVNVHSELNNVLYPEFVGGDQDPISWLDDIENAFEANLVQEARKIPIISAKLKGPVATWWRIRQSQSPKINQWNNKANPLQSFQANFVTKFVTPELKANWFQKLTQRKQIIGERVDDYYVDIAGLIRRLEIGGYPFTEVMKVQAFVQGLHPELSLAILLLIPKTIEDACNKAKAYENAYEYCFSSSTLQAQPVNYSSPYSSFCITPTNPLIEDNTHQTIKALNKLTNLINMMTNKVPNQEQLFQPPTTSNPNNDEVLCKCPKFTYKVPPNLTIPISSKPLVSAAPITQNASRLDCSIAPLTTSTQKDNSISPRNLNNLSVKPFDHGTRFLPAGKHASQRSTQENPRQQQNNIESLDSEI